MSKPKLRIVSVMWSKKRGCWYVRRGNSVDYFEGATKAWLVSRMRWCCAWDGYEEGIPTSLRVHKQNGQFQFECTYPRSSDPRRSKG